MDDGSARAAGRGTGRLIPVAAAEGGTGGRGLQSAGVAGSTLLLIPGAAGL